MLKNFTSHFETGMNQIMEKTYHSWPQIVRIMNTQKQQPLPYRTKTARKDTTVNAVTPKPKHVKFTMPSGTNTNPGFENPCLSGRQACYPENNFKNTVATDNMEVASWVNLLLH